MSRTLIAPTLGFGLLALLAGPGCATLGLGSGQPLVPTQYQTRTGPYTVFTNFPVAADAPAIRHLQSLEHQLEAHLGVRVDPKEAPIEVYILNDRKAFAHFLAFYYPELPSRRAFFLAQGDRRVVYTYLGDRLEEDLRHEATHALLHASVAELPLWLDEGLAEYFEGPDSRNGVNPEHLAKLPADLAKGWTPDLERLETLQDVRQMSPRDYRESWAWVHYLLNGPAPGKTALLAYLADLRTSPETPTLSRRLDLADKGPKAGMLAHLDQIKERPVAATASSSIPAPVPQPTVRLQSAPVELPIQPTGRRRSVLDRVRDLLRAGKKGQDASALAGS